jgi:hypothetical protein
VRAQQQVERKEKQAIEERIDSWGADDSWGEENADIDLEAMLEAREKSKDPQDFSKPTEKQPQKLEDDELINHLQHNELKGFVPYYIEVEEEPKEKIKKNIKKEKELLKQYQLDGEGGEQWANEAYESVKDTFWKFQKRLQRSPEQCLR